MNIPDLSGKTAVVTGTGGIGYQIAYALAGNGAKVILGGRNKEAGDEAVSNIKKDFPKASVKFELIDLSDTKSIAAFCKRIESKLKKLDILMNIAGLMMPDKLSKTKEGVEMQFAVNYLGHYNLTCRLFKLLQASGDARVITISSIANRPTRFDLRDVTAANGYSASVSYALSKLACLMFALELDKRSKEKGWGVSGYCVHPGLAKTQLFNRSREFTMRLLQGIFFILPFIRQSAKRAAQPALFAATSPKAKSGCYYGPWFFGIMGPPRKALIPKRAKNRKLRSELWTLSAALTRVDIR